MNNELTFYEVIELQQLKINKYEERIKRIETLYIKVAILLTIIVFGYGFILISLKNRIEEVESNVTIIHNN